MASYYYLIASLPMLKAEGETNLSYSAFLDMCRSAVSPSVYRALEDISNLSANGPLIRQWREFYGKLTQELVYQRSLKLGKPAVLPKDRPSEVVNAVAAALAAKNPLEAEKVLLRCEFDHLDSLVSLHNFDDYVLYGYAIKLKLLERQNSFDHEEGKKEFRSLFEDVQRRVLSL